MSSDPAQSGPCIFVVDDDPKMLRLVAEVLGAAGLRVETFARAGDFLKSYSADRRGCLLLDIQMPGLSGPELQRELTARQIDIPIIFLTATADVDTTVALMKQGAMDLVQKPFDPQALCSAVQRAIAHDAATSVERRQREVIRDRLKRLTPREREVMSLVVEGRANKQIAQELQLSEKTIEIHRGRMMRKMEADSIADLVRQSVATSDAGPDGLS